MSKFPRTQAGKMANRYRLLQGAGGGRQAIIAPVQRLPRMQVVQAVTEIVPFSSYGAVALTTAADATGWVVGQGGSTGGFIDQGTISLSTAGSTSTVVTIYVNGSSIGTLTYASGDTTPQTDALTPTKVVVGDLITARVTTAGTGAKGLSGFVPIRP